MQWGIGGENGTGLGGGGPCGWNRSWKMRTGHLAVRLTQTIKTAEARHSQTSGSGGRETLCIGWETRSEKQNETKKWAERLKKKEKEKKKNTEQRPLLPTKCTSLGSERSFQKDEVNEHRGSVAVERDRTRFTRRVCARARRTSSPARRAIPEFFLRVTLCFQHQGPICAPRTATRSTRRLGPACTDGAMRPPHPGTGCSGRDSGQAWFPGAPAASSSWSPARGLLPDGTWAVLPSSAASGHRQAQYPVLGLTAPVAPTWQLPAWSRFTRRPPSVPGRPCIPTSPWRSSREPFIPNPTFTTLQQHLAHQT